MEEAIKKNSDAQSEKDGYKGTVKILETRIEAINEKREEARLMSLRLHYRIGVLRFLIRRYDRYCTDIKRRNKAAIDESDRQFSDLKRAEEKAKDALRS